MRATAVTAPSDCRFASWGSVADRGLGCGPESPWASSAGNGPQTQGYGRQDTDVRQLELFLAVVEERTFTQAARRSYVSQSGLSSSVRALEREPGVALFTRGSSGATLTAAGEAFLPRARRMLADARAAKRELMGLGSSRSLRLGSEQCLGDLVNLADVLTDFASPRDSIEVCFQQAPSETLLRDLRSGGLDVALAAVPLEGTDLSRDVVLALSPQAGSAARALASMFLVGTAGRASASHGTAGGSVTAGTTADAPGRAGP